MRTEIFGFPFLFAAFLVSTMFSLTGGALAQVSGKAFQGFSQDSNEPIQIEADQLEVQDGKNRAIFSGKVRVRQGTSLITTNRLTVYYSGEQKASEAQSGDIERLELDGEVVVTSDDNVASADRGSYDVANDVATLDGDVVISQGENAAKGCKLVAYLKTSQAKLEPCKNGRVTTIFTPGSSSTAKKKKN